MSKDQAAKIVASVCLDPNVEPVGAEVKLQRLIRRAIAAAVRKERDRCVHCACKEFGFVHHKTLDAIIKSINATAKNRKGKR